MTDPENMRERMAEALLWARDRGLTVDDPRTIDAILDVLTEPSDESLEAAWLPVSGKFDVGYVCPSEVTLEILRLYFTAIREGA